MAWLWRVSRRAVTHHQHRSMVELLLADVEQHFQALARAPASILRHIGRPFAPDKDHNTPLSLAPGRIIILEAYSLFGDLPVSGLLDRDSTWPTRLCACMHLVCEHLQDQMYWSMAYRPLLSHLAASDNSAMNESTWEQLRAFLRKVYNTTDSRCDSLTGEYQWTQTDVNGQF
jgi:hypothetical protein